MASPAGEMLHKNKQYMMICFQISDTQLTIDRLIVTCYMYVINNITLKVHFSYTTAIIEIYHCGRRSIY